MIQHSNCFHIKSLGLLEQFNRRLSFAFKMDQEEEKISQQLEVVYASIDGEKEGVKDLKKEEENECRDR